MVFHEMSLLSDLAVEVCQERAEERWTIEGAVRNGPLVCTEKTFTSDDSVAVTKREAVAQFEQATIVTLGSKPSGSIALGF